MIELDKNQLAAKTAVLDWLDASPEPIFRIFGYAGTGKTTIIKELIKELDCVTFGAFTGKAAMVMRSTGLDANTIHSLIYKPIFPNPERIERLKGQLEGAKNSKDRAIIKEELKEARKIKFRHNNESPLYDSDLVVLDECSMINEEMKAHLLAFDVPMLILGDPGQLPPIHGTGALVEGKPDVLLTEIHRQARDNPIIKLSEAARKGHPIFNGQYGESCVGTARHFDYSKIDSADQVIVGMNKTRIKWNQAIRQARGFTGTFPQEGERLICLRNNAEIGLFNGLCCAVEKLLDETDQTLTVELSLELGGKVTTSIHKAHFEEYNKPGLVKSMEWWELKRADEFDFGYAITVHKSQGSQWDRVLFYDDGFLDWDRVEKKRWLYTGITRAAKAIILLQ